MNGENVRCASWRIIFVYVTGILFETKLLQFISKRKVFHLLLRAAVVAAIEDRGLDFAGGDALGEQVEVRTQCARDDLLRPIALHGDRERGS